MNELGGLKRPPFSCRAGKVSPIFHTPPQTVRNGRRRRGGGFPTFSPLLGPKEPPARSSGPALCPAPESTGANRRLLPSPASGQRAASDQPSASLPRPRAPNARAPRKPILARSRSNPSRSRCSGWKSACGKGSIPRRSRLGQLLGNGPKKSPLAAFAVPVLREGRSRCSPAPNSGPRVVENPRALGNGGGPSVLSRRWSYFSRPDSSGRGRPPNQVGS